MLKKLTMLFTCIFFIIQTNINNAILPIYEYRKGCPLYLYVYINELADQKILDGTYTEENINDFRAEKENLYMRHLRQANKNTIKFTFDKKVEKYFQNQIMTLASILQLSGELQEDTLEDFLTQRQNRLLSMKSKLKNKKNKNESKKKHRDTNKEKILEQKKEYYDENKEKIKERSKNYRDNNKEKTKKIQKKHRDNNKEKIRERNKKYRDNNKEKIKERKKQRRLAKKNAAQNGNKAEQHELLNKIKKLNSDTIQDLIIEGNLEFYNCPTPNTLSAAETLLTFYQYATPGTPFCNHVEKAIYITDDEKEFLPISDEGFSVNSCTGEQIKIDQEYNTDVSLLKKRSKLSRDADNDTPATKKTRLNDQ